MVERIFWKDAYQTECDARVVSIKGNIVRLDRTVFYAFSGGQLSDHGTINGINVVDARKTEDNDIEYELESEPNFKIGDEVKVEINWKRRLLLMRTHTAQHIAATIFELKNPEVKALGSNVKAGKASVTYEYDTNFNEVIEWLEKESNDFANEDHNIEIFTDSSDPFYRHWKCAHMECGCGGTHVKNTREVGRIKLKRKNAGAGKETVEIIVE